MFATTRLVLLITMLATVMAVCDPKKQETGTLTLTEEQYEDFYCDSTIGLVVEKSDKNKREYRAIQTVSINQLIPPVQVDCWALFDQFMAANKPLFQLWANKHCRTYLSCWCCPGGGLCVAFFVKPKSPPCFKWEAAAYQKTLAVFEP